MPPANNNLWLPMLVKRPGSCKSSVCTNRRYGSAPPASPPATNLVRCSVRGVPGSRCPRPKSATALPSKRPSLPLAETKVHCTLKTPPFLHVPAVPNSYPRPRPLHNRCESPHTFCVPARERAPIAPPASPAALRPAGFRRPKGGLFLVNSNVQASSANYDGSARAGGRDEPAGP